MKKALVSLLLVLLTLCLFVSCSSSPNIDEEELAQSITFAYGVKTVIFNRDGSANFIDNKNNVNVQIPFSFTQTEGLTLSNPIVMSFYKDESYTKITSVDELFSLSSVYNYNHSEWENWPKK